MRPEGVSSRTGDSSVYSAATRLATGWARRYTRGVDPRFAADRGSELAFELWEHGAAAERDGWSGGRATASLLVRTAVGAPGDWWWRWRTIHDLVPPSSPIRLVGRRRRSHFWVPLRMGHVFDQTNGVIEGERAVPYDRTTRSFGAAGNAFGLQGGF